MMIAIAIKPIAAIAILLAVRFVALAILKKIPDGKLKRLLSYRTNGAASSDTGKRFIQ